MDNPNLHYQSTWRIQDILDMEYFFWIDAHQHDQEANIVHEDRVFFQNTIMPLIPQGKDISNRLILRQWIEFRRELHAHSNDSSALPGSIYTELYQFVSITCIVISIMLGVSVTLSLMNYHGTQPINVFTYLFGLVITQLFLFALLVFGILFRCFHRKRNNTFILKSLLIHLCIQLMLKGKQLFRKNIATEKWNTLEAVIGIINEKKHIYGSLIYLPIFELLQLAGVCFNIGILCSTLVKIIISDVAFGWQSTLQMSAVVLHEWVNIVASPWSWLMASSMAYPSLEQIEGSRMILKEGIYHLATSDLISWWPFLCFSVLFYGLCLRLFLLCIGKLYQCVCLMRLDFKHAACDQRIRQMYSPIVDIVDLKKTDSLNKPIMQPELLPIHLSLNKIYSDVVLLISDDIFNQCHDSELNQYIFNTLGCTIKQKYKYTIDDTIDQGLFELLKTIHWKKNALSLLMIQEAWLPPIMEHVSFIRTLRKQIGQTTLIYIGLIGKPKMDDIFTHVNDGDFNVWQQKIHSLSDAFLCV
ncbi:MAG: DUF2868 domain-containing protein, partial [Desulfobacterales bacterium]|nr:DUF2868 domain-containing protein [Desulfobacterales bacterium]